MTLSFSQGKVSCGSLISFIPCCMKCVNLLKILSQNLNQGSYGRFLTYKINIVLKITFKEHHCIILHRMQLLHIHQKIFEYASQDFRIPSQDFRIYITRFWTYITSRLLNIHHKILNIQHKIIEYTSQDYRIYITRYWTCITRIQYALQDFWI